MDKQCPECGLLCPPTALACDCGIGLENVKPGDAQGDQASQHAGGMIIGLGVAIVAAGLTILCLVGGSSRIYVWSGGVIFGLTLFLRSYTLWNRFRS